MTTTWDPDGSIGFALYDRDTANMVGWYEKVEQAWHYADALIAANPQMPTLRTDLVVLRYQGDKPLQLVEREVVMESEYQPETTPEVPDGEDAPSEAPQIEPATEEEPEEEEETSA